MTQNLADRIAQHNTGKSKFTSGHLPWKLVHQENFETTLDAAKEKNILSQLPEEDFLMPSMGPVPCPTDCVSGQAGIPASGTEAL